MTPVAAPKYGLYANYCRGRTSKFELTRVFPSEGFNGIFHSHAFVTRRCSLNSRARFARNLFRSTWKPSKYAAPRFRTDRPSSGCQFIPISICIVTLARGKTKRATRLRLRVSDRPRMYRLKRSSIGLSSPRRSRSPILLACPITGNGN